MMCKRPWRWKEIGDKIKGAIKRAPRLIINYFKLFLIPPIFIFMVLALTYKGVERLIGKCKRHPLWGK